MSAWFVYFILILDSVGHFIAILMGVVAVCSFFLMSAFAGSDTQSKREQNGIEWLKGRHFVMPAGLLISLAFVKTALPSTKQAAIIFGLSEITQSERVSEISGKSLKLLEKYLDKSLKEDKK